MQEETLHSAQYELENLRHVFDIPAHEVVLRQRIDGGSEGAFGEVWSAEWHDRVVAVKKLRATIMMLDDEAFADFEKEINLLRFLRHRNIAFFYGAGVIDNVPFLMLEYCTRGSLFVVLKVAPLFSFSKYFKHSI